MKALGIPAQSGRWGCQDAPSASPKTHSRSAQLAPLGSVRACTVQNGNTRRHGLAITFDVGAPVQPDSDTGSLRVSPQHPENSIFLTPGLTPILGRENGGHDRIRVARGIAKCATGRPRGPAPPAPGHPARYRRACISRPMCAVAALTTPTEETSWAHSNDGGAASLPFMLETWDSVDATSGPEC